MGSAPPRPLGGACLAVGMVGLAVSLSSAVPLWCWVVSSATCGLGMGMAYSPLSVVTLARADPDRQGEATSSLQLTDVLGYALGTGVAGAIVTLGDPLGHEDSGGARGALRHGGVMAVVVGVLARRLTVRRSGVRPGSVVG